MLPGLMRSVNKKECPRCLVSSVTDNVAAHCLRIRSHLGAFVSSAVHAIFPIEAISLRNSQEMQGGGSGHSGRHCPTKTFAVCRDMDWGRSVHVPAMACDILCRCCAWLEVLVST